MKTSVKYKVIYRHKGKYSINEMCKFFCVSRSGYYGFVSRMGTSDRELPLAEKIRKCQNENKQTYGYRRVVIWLEKEGKISISEEQIYRIKSYMTDIKTEKLMFAIAEYYITNHEPDSDWVILPKTNISAYLGSASYMDSYESKIPEDFMTKKPENNGVSAIKVNI